MAENVTPVTLKVGDFAPREVLSVDYKFNKSTDVEGQVNGAPRGGLVTVRVNALNDGNSELVGWMLDVSNPKDFTISFLSTKDGKSMKTLEGKSAYCIKYVERWEEGVGHYEEIVISCKEFKNGPAEITNPWK